MNAQTTIIRNFFSLKNRANRLLSEISCWSLRKIILIGLIPRLLLMPFIAHPFDVQVWYNICEDFLRGSFSFNPVLLWSRPLWFLTLVPISYLYNFLSSITGLKAIPVNILPLSMNPQFGATYVTDSLFNFIVKVPMLAADIGTTLILYKIVAEFSDSKMRQRDAALYYLSPILIWISAAWGQYESIIAFFTIYSLYLLLKKKITYSALSLLVATLFKIYPAIFIIPVTVFFS